MTEFVTRRVDSDVAAADGTVLQVRDLGPADEGDLCELHERVSDDNLYLRYFSGSRTNAVRFAKLLAAPSDDRHRALGAFAGEQLVGVADFERTGPAVAEFAVLVADDHHGTGIGTLLLEHLIAAARGAGIGRFSADVLTTNAAMIRVIRDLGFHAHVETAYGVQHVEFDLDTTAQFQHAIAERDRAAAGASIRPLLAPRSIAVAGAGRNPRSAGRAVLTNLVDGGFGGRLFAVNRAGVDVDGIPGFASAAELPEPVDLLVVAVPASDAVEVVEQAGARGVRAAVVISAGFAESGAAGFDLQRQLLHVARRHGMRLLGPNCLGVVNTDPAVRVNATFANLPARPGGLGVFAQSGAFGIGLLDAADGVGLGVAQFASVGNKADVGGNDLLLAWQDDPRIHVICGYLESVGDPLRFARIAGEVSRSKPVLAIKSGTTEVGRRAGQSHTAAAASSDVAIEALFRAAGVLRMRSTHELLDAARVLGEQPVPRGPRVAIVGNSGGPQILAADAATTAGLHVVDLDAETRSRLRDLGVTAANPLDLGAGTSADAFAAAVGALLESPSVDAVLTVFTEVMTSDATSAEAGLVAAAAAADKPVVAVRVGRPDGLLPAADDVRRIPTFGYPEAAAGALAAAYRYSLLRDRPRTAAARPAGCDLASARALVGAALVDGSEWLDAERSAALLANYGITVCAQRVVHDAGAAVAAAAAWGYPVVAKLAGAGLHKTELGGVRTGLRDEGGLRRAVEELLALPAPGDRAVLVQPMISGGTELLVGSVHDPDVGPLVALGAGGVLTDILDDRTFRLAPLTNVEAESMIMDLRVARLLNGYRGTPVIPHDGIVDALTRVAALVHDVPEIAELDINPLICRPDGVVAVDARIRIAAPPEHPDPFLRRLREASGTRPCSAPQGGP